MIGAEGQAAWLQQYDFSTNSAAATNTVTLSGTAIALSPSPLFDVSDQDVAIAVSGTPNRLEYVLLGNNPPTVPGNVDLTSLGSPIGVSTGSQSVWLLTDSQLAELAIQALGLQSSAALPTFTYQPGRRR